jgi:predicted RNA polymerase sigma factor
MTSISGPLSTSPDPSSADHIIEQTYRSDWGRLVALLVLRTRRLDLVEDAASAAFERAATRWAIEGIPANPSGWIYTTAWRFILGTLRTEEVAGRKAPLLAVGSPCWAADADNHSYPDDLGELGDERLQLILLCCHPALPTESRSALALRLVIGTSTEEIARLFLVSTATMAARLTRAKKKIVLAGIPLNSPLHDELQDRLDEVCRTVYLAFTAGYAPGTGSDLLRSDLASEAVQLASVLQVLTPDSPQVQALLALLLLQHARRDARVCDGKLITLADQDRSRWRADELQAALAIATHLRPVKGYAEELRLQVLIAAEHVVAPTSAQTNWRAIADTYAALEQLTGSPIVRLNRAVAVAEADGPWAGLKLLEGLGEVLPGNHRVAAVRAELAQRCGDIDLARRSLNEALALCTNESEQSYLTAKLHRLTQIDH